MPSGHLIKRAEQAQCRAGAVPSWHLTKRAEAGTRRAEQALDVPSRRSFEAGVEATVKVGSPNGPLVLARPTSFDGSPQPRLMARPIRARPVSTGFAQYGPMSTGLPNLV